MRMSFEDLVAFAKAEGGALVKYVRLHTGKFVFCHAFVPGGKTLDHAEIVESGEEAISAGRLMVMGDSWKITDVDSESLKLYNTPTEDDIELLTPLFAKEGISYGGRNA